MAITHPQLVSALVKGPVAILQSITEEAVDLWHAATGIAGECGELLEGIHDHKPLYEARENVLEESGDIYFYTEQLVQQTKIWIDWTGIKTYANGNHITPDLAEFYAAKCAIYGSQVLDTVKKCAIYNKPVDIDLLSNQLVLMLQNVVTIGYMFGVSREEALEANIAKLSKRYEGIKYSDAAAQQRADKVEESIQESREEIHRKYFGKEPEVGAPVAVPITKPDA